ncbi:unnamed protein product [Amoebophrya sp. A120]|nr:unnamed protein product [Amoebophrya sp. A120]|eukprot:GSA120T00022520001.1
MTGDERGSGSRQRKRMCGFCNVFTTLVVSLHLLLAPTSPVSARSCPGRTYTVNDYIEADCVTYEGQLRFEGIWGLKEINMPRLKRVRGGLFIEDNPDLESIYMPLLERVDHRLERSIIIRNNGLGYILTTTPPPQVYKTTTAAPSTTSTTSTSTTTTSLTLFPMFRSLGQVFGGKNAEKHARMLSEEQKTSPARTSTGSERETSEQQAGHAHEDIDPTHYPDEKNNKPADGAGLQPGREQQASSSPRALTTTQMGFTTAENPLGQYTYSTRRWITRSNPIANSMNFPRVTYISNNIEITNNMKLQYLLMAYGNSLNPLANYFNTPRTGPPIDWPRVGERDGDGNLLTTETAVVAGPGQVLLATAGPPTLSGPSLVVFESNSDDGSTTLPPTTTTTTTTTLEFAFIGVTAQDRTSIILHSNPDLVFMNIGGNVRGEVHIRENPALRSMSMDMMNSIRMTVFIHDNPVLNGINFPALTEVLSTGLHSLVLRDNGIACTYSGFMRFPSLQRISGMVTITGNRWFGVIEFPSLVETGPVPSDGYRRLEDGHQKAAVGSATETISERRQEQHTTPPKSKNKSSTSKVVTTTRGSKNVDRHNHPNSLDNRRGGQKVPDLLSPPDWRSGLMSEGEKEQRRLMFSEREELELEKHAALEREKWDAEIEIAENNEKQLFGGRVRQLTTGTPYTTGKVSVNSVTITDNQRLYYVKYSGILYGSMQVSAQSDLVNIDSPDLREIRGMLWIENNAQLARVSLANLQTLGDTFDYSLKFVSNGQGAQERTGFFQAHVLRSTTRGIVFAENQNFARLQFPQMQSTGETLGSSVFVQNNKDLSLLDFNGEMEGNVVIHNNPDVESIRLEGLAKVKNDGNLYFTDNQALHTANLVQLVELTGDLVLGRNGLLARAHGSVTAPLLKLVGGRIRIEQNFNLGNLVFPQLDSIGQAEGESVGVFQNVNFQCWNILFNALRFVGGYIQYKDNFMLDQMEFDSMGNCGPAQAELGSYCPSARFICAARQVRYPPYDLGIPELKFLSPLEVTLEADLTDRLLYGVPLLNDDMARVYAKYCKVDPIQVKILSYAITNPALVPGSISGAAQTTVAPGSSTTPSNGTSSLRELQPYDYPSNYPAVALNGDQRSSQLKGRQLGQVARLLGVRVEVITTSSIELQRVYNRIASFSPATFADMTADLVIELATHMNTLQIISVGRINITSTFGLEGITQPPIPEGTYLDTSDMVDLTKARERPVDPADAGATAEKETDYTWFIVIGCVVAFGLLVFRLFVFLTMQSALQANLLEQERERIEREEREKYEEEYYAQKEMEAKAKDHMLVLGSQLVMNNDEKREDLEFGATMGSSAAEMQMLSQMTSSPSASHSKHKIAPMAITDGSAGFDGSPTAASGTLAIMDRSFMQSTQSKMPQIFRYDDGSRVAPVDYGDGIVVAPGVQPSKRYIGGKVKITHKKKTTRGNPEAYTNFLRDRIHNADETNVYEV